MPNVTFVEIASSSGGTGNFIASAISTNFNNVRTLANTVLGGGFDNDNYATNSSGFGSAYISTGQINSGHLTSGAIASGKFSETTLGNTNFDYVSANAGVMAVKYASGYQSLAKFCMATMTKSWTGNVQTLVMTFSYPDAVYGNPGFTTTPEPVGWPVVSQLETMTSGQGIRQCAITSQNSNECHVSAMFDLILNGVHHHTYYMAFIGN